MAPSTYGDYLTSIGLSDSTIDEYQREIGWILEWCAVRRVDLADITPSQLREYQVNRPNTPSVRSHLRSAACHWWDWKEVRGWPGAIEVPIPAPMQSKALEPDEAARLIKAAADWWRAGTATIIALAMGLRNQGIREMRWDRFDPSMEWYTATEKGNRQRHIPVPGLVASELDGRQNGTPWVFKGRLNGGPVSHQTINNWIKQVGQAAGFSVSDVWPHRMRHTFAADVLEQTGDLDAVAT